MLSTDTNALNYQIPGGMLSNLVAQLTAQNKMDKFNDVLLETPKVRKDLGYPPLVTPMSQMVGVQATVNVLVGERYKNISKEVKAYIKGEYGRAPGEIDKDLMKRFSATKSLLRADLPTLSNPVLKRLKKKSEKRQRVTKMFFLILHSRLKLKHFLINAKKKKKILLNIQ